MGFSGRNGGKGGFRSSQGVRTAFNKQRSFNNNNGRGGNFRRRGEPLSDGLDRATSQSIAAAFGISRPDRRPFRRNNNNWGGGKGNNRNNNGMREISGSIKGKGGKRGGGGRKREGKRGGAGRGGRGGRGGKGSASVESLDKELETYMGPEAAKASLDQELEKYMAQK